MAADTRPIDPLGRPDLTYDKGTGLGVLIRKFEVKGKYTTAAQLPANVKRAFEAEDFEHSGFLLAEQVIDGTEVQDGEISILRETYVEVPSDAATKVQIGGDLVTYDRNGLKQTEQRFFVKRTHSLTGTVGTTTGVVDTEDPEYNASIAGLYLSFNGFTERGKVSAIVVKRWHESGILNQTEDLVGSQQAVTIQAIGEVPTTPSGYLLARTRQGNYEGFKTNDYTFLEPSILSVRNPKVGGPQQVTVEAFSRTEAQVIAAISEVTANHKLIDRSDSNYEGIKTTRFVFEVDDFEVLSATENGLALLERTQLDTVAFTRGDVGTDTYASLTLINEEIENGNTIKKRVSRYGEAGIIDVSEGSGPSQIPGSRRVTIISQVLAYLPSEAGYTVGEETLETKRNSNVNGFKRFVRTYLIVPSGLTITGDKFITKDRVQVDVPGTIELSTQSVSNSTVSGTVAVFKHTPKSKLSVNAELKISVVTEPEPALDIAFDIGNIGCSLYAVGTSSQKNFGISNLDFSQSFSASVDTPDYPGCYIVGPTTITGIVSYVSKSINGTNSGLAESSTDIVATGSTNADGYKTSGLIKRKPRHILTTDDGTSYYEVITWTV